MGFAAGDFARFRRQFGDGTAQAAREKDGQQERDAGGGEAGNETRLINARQIGNELALGLTDHDGQLRAVGVA